MVYVCNTLVGAHACTHMERTEEGAQHPSPSSLCLITLRQSPAEHGACCFRLDWQAEDPISLCVFARVTGVQGHRELAVWVSPFALGS